MKLESTSLEGVWLVTPERHLDERGFFARTFCAREFGEAGLCASFVQQNISFNEREHTLRGIHWQEEPRGESKLVRCTSGKLCDVVVDLRPDSATYLQHYMTILSAESRQQLYIPSGCGHAFLTLVERTEVHYSMSEFFSPDHAAGARWNDPAFGIRWPHSPEVISERDATYPDWVPERGAD